MKDLSVCVIGAGASGLPALKACLDAHWQCDCYDMSEHIGGLWSDTVSGAAYDSLVINTHKDMMQYLDYPMPEEWPEYVPRLKIVEYFKDYVNHFKLNDHIHLQHQVLSTSRKPSGGWRVEVKNLADNSIEQKEYDILLVANGHHSKPKWPKANEYPGLENFPGIQMHSHEYQSPQAHHLKGKRILVVGGGNSAMDIACELGSPALQNQVTISMRRGVHVWPKWVLGKPSPLILKYGPKDPPKWYFKLTGALTMTFFALDLEKYGMLKPDHAPSDAHPTISDNFGPAVRDQRITIKPGIKQFNDDTVTFVSVPNNPMHKEESSKAFDVIIWCTGYDVELPFIDPSIVEVKNNYIPLWHRMIKPGIMDLCFVGLFQPLGAVMPLAEAQVKLYVKFLQGEIEFPDDASMTKDINERQRAHDNRFYQSARHTMEEFQYQFLDVLQNYSKRYRKRYKKRQPFKPKHG